ncbi:MarR family winged helix-turn-helix transcriptional regulator [Micromonospora sp. U21]|uniref:MarR family winged helix-turn-helix transcriptional regulator n=1 Tax=Micromonospora sp. U21 TaxID=2824899 RepID=UPI001B3873F0|nr:MarR family transcriptional regulator [Micromonospora sp. U21]MBQ0902409.1 MarR family transcriptional regulator [Micromonospora sp. U21]
MDLSAHPPGVPAGADADLVDGLAALSRALVGITAHTLATLDVEVTLSQYRTIVVLASRGPVRTVDLAAALHVHPSTVTRTCDRLERRGLVARHQGATDRRVSWLILTESGKSLVGEVMRRRTAQIRELVRTPEAAAARSLAELVEALAVASGEPSERQWWHRWEHCTDLTPTSAAG